MELISKVASIALGGVAIGGASAMYSYSTSIDSKVEDKAPKRKVVVSGTPKGKGYEECLKEPKFAEKGRNKKICG